MKKCLLFHDWKQTNVKENREVIGKIPSQWEEGIYKVEITTTEFYKCTKCGKEKEESMRKTETHRQFYR